MSKIVFDDGKEVKLSKETTERLKKELLHNIPRSICVGQIFGCYGENYMVASLGSDSSKVGLTNVGGSYSGCYNTELLTGVRSREEVRQLLIDKDAEYLGYFNEVFVKKC